MTSRFGFVCAALVVGIISLTAKGTAESPSGVSRLDTYTSADGETYFALSLKPNASDASPANTEVVVLFDTSASQFGEYRTAALATLRKFLKQAGNNDRVKLIAVDLDATPLTNGFVAPGSAALDEALEKLNRRVPLGSTDMEKAVESAVDSFQKSGDGKRAVVYIGDGQSAAKKVAGENLRSLIGQCVEKRLPITSYAIGPGAQPFFLATLANQTGGRVLLDGSQINPDGAARELAAAVKGTVVWPEGVTWPQGVTAYPNPLQPLRTDRDNIVVGKGATIVNSKIELNGLVDGETRTFYFDQPASKSEAANSYLANLVTEAAKNSGLTLATLGTSGLGKIRQGIAHNVESLNRLAQSASSVNNSGAAGRLARGAQKLDPEDPDANAILRHDRQLSSDDHNLLDGFIDDSGEGIDTVRQRQQVVTDAVKTDTKETLEKANRLMAVDPQTGEELLKLQLDKVRDALDLDPDVRLQLENELKSAVRLAGTRKIEHDQERREQQEVEARKIERQRLVTDLERKQQAMNAMMVRFSSLMKEDRYDQAELTVAEVQQVSRDNALLPDPAITAASESSHNTMMYEEYLVAVQQYNRGVTRQYLDVLKSSIPMPIDTPIIYPDAQQWQSLTERRKKWSEVDLQIKSAAEKKILKELDEIIGPEVIDFPDPTPLVLVLARISASTSTPGQDDGMQIQLDDRNLEELGIASDTPVQMKVAGITLRSAIKLLLLKIDPELTYTIQDEVLMITTKEAATENLTTKVYPVADLVLPITLDTTGVGGFGSNTSGGMMGFGGMGGGQSAGMGGMGGGGMGGGGMGGGGMGGGMGGGGGGGMFSDQRLKTDIEPIGMSPSGITIYRFRYWGDCRLYEGVMAQELLETHPEAVVLMPSGFYAVLYDQIDVEFFELSGAEPILTGP